MRNKRKINNIYVFYRISDNGFKNKIKPSYITKYNCLKNALNVFKGDNVFFKVYVDSVVDETDKLIHLLCDGRKNVEVINIDTKSNGFSFRKVYEDACLLKDDDLVYFLEDDYLHKEESLSILVDAAKCNYSDYITLYDHPDKYDNNKTGVNPFCSDFGETTKVFKTNTHHWKITNSTTMTFAAFADVLKRDKNVFWKYTETGYPYDFDIFMELINQNKYLSSPIPSLSTHGETNFLASFTDWEKVSNGKNCCIAIITHKERLDGDDERSFLQAIKIFGGNRDIKVIIPNNIPTDYYDKFKNVVEICQVDSNYLCSFKKYNEFCCKKEFYHIFARYDYMLIYQTDCWVFEDRLDYFMGLGYDYYGAPWPHLGDNVGNGGLSLRKVRKMLEITNEHTYDANIRFPNEDTWFCLLHKDELNVCDLNNACNFSMEIVRPKYINAIIKHPMGLHGRDMKRFWDENGSKFEMFYKKI